MHDRYAVDHDFLSPEVGDEVITISRLINAFFRWEFNSCETLVRGSDAYPIDYANASPDVALTSLHYYFPWAMSALLKWCVFCVVTAPPPAARPRHPQLLRDRRPRGPLLCGEARGLPRARRRVLRGRPLPGLLRQPAVARRRARARLDQLGGVRPPARGHRPRRVSGARARAVHRPLPRPGRPVGARAGRDGDAVAVITRRERAARSRDPRPLPDPRPAPRPRQAAPRFEASSRRYVSAAERAAVRNAARRTPCPGR